MHASLESLEPRRLLASGSILFIRGAERSGGFLEAQNDAGRTEQLADINNSSTASGNHGWGTLAKTLRDAGYVVSQMIEPQETGALATGQVVGAPIRFERLDLSRYDAVVFGSNNARYTKTQINAVDNYVRGGGAALFISDANFGSDWADAPTSDQQFLNRFGLVVNQDDGTYALTRPIDFAAASHPIFQGVTSFDGEGVSPLRAAQEPLPADIRVRRLVGAKGNTADNDETPAGAQQRGTARPVNDADASLITANVGLGRVAGHFDRNTFFNANGAGTDITRLDNQQYALNLFGWLTDNDAPGLLSAKFYSTPKQVARVVLTENLAGSLTSADVKLRDRSTGQLIDRSVYALRITEEDGRTVLDVRMRSSALPAGAYRVEIRENGISDSAGNRRRSAIRFNFDVK